MHRPAALLDPNGRKSDFLVQNSGFCTPAIFDEKRDLLNLPKCVFPEEKSIPK